MELYLHAHIAKVPALANVFRYLWSEMESVDSDGDGLRILRTALHQSFSEPAHLSIIPVY